MIVLHIGIVKSQTGHLIVWTGISSQFEVLITASFLTFAKRQRYRHLTTNPQALPPESVCHFHSSERHRGNWITGMQGLLLYTYIQCRTYSPKDYPSFFHKLHLEIDIITLYSNPEWAALANVG